MKTIKKGKKIVRVSDDEAATSTKKGWKYCPKSEWREKVRDVEPEKKKKKGKKRA
jgi:hypothetical protein